jgi:hypothetical protein
MNFSALGSREKATFVNVFESKFEIEVDGPLTGVKNYITRVNKLGRTIHALHFDTLGIFITNVTVNVHESYGYQLRIRGVLGDEEYLLTLGMSGIGASVAKQLPKVDFSKMATIEVYLNKNTERTGVSIKQLDPATGKLEWVGNYWTKEDPKDIPAWEKVMVKGVEQWDNSKEVLFLKNYIETQVQPMVAAAAPKAAQGTQLTGSNEQAIAPTDVQTHAPVTTSHEAMNELAGEAPAAQFVTVEYPSDDINPADIPF